ncbi:MAG: thioredoxin family protein [Candidatus Babeliales bacterium]
MKKYSIVVGLLLCIPTLSVGSAPHKAVRSASTFHSLLKQQPFSVVFFYDQDKQLVTCSKKHPQAACHIQVHTNKNAQRTINTTRHNKQYHKADLMFIKVNVAYRGLDAVANEYGIKKFPTFMLFKHGVPVHAKNGGIAVLSGSATPEQLHAFIERHLGHAIDLRVEYKQEAYYQGLNEQTWDNVFYGYPNSNFNAVYDEENPANVGFGFTIP